MAEARRRRGDHLAALSVLVLACSISPTAATCSGEAIFEAPDGAISVVPDDAVRTTECSFLIHASSSAVGLTLNFTSFALGCATSDNEQGFVRVFDGATHLSPLIGSYECGATPVVATTAPSVLVWFWASSRAAAGGGFNLTWAPSEPACGNGVCERSADEFDACPADCAPAAHALPPSGLSFQNIKICDDGHQDAFLAVSAGETRVVPFVRALFGPDLPSTPVSYNFGVVDELDPSSSPSACAALPHVSGAGADALGGAPAASVALLADMWGENCPFLDKAMHIEGAGASLALIQADVDKETGDEMDLFLMKAKDGHAHRAAALDAPTLLIGNASAAWMRSRLRPHGVEIRLGVGVRQCGGEVRQAGERGAFASGRGARRYCGWQQCAWHLVAPEDDIVVLWFPSFQLECMEGPSGPFDAVRVYDGASLLSPSLGVFSCRTAATVASTGSHVLVQVRAPLAPRRSPRAAPAPAPPRPYPPTSPRLRPASASQFKTDRYFHYEGFSAEWASGAEYCGAAPSCSECAALSPCLWCRSSRSCVPRTGGRAVCEANASVGDGYDLECCAPGWAGEDCGDCAHGHYGAECTPCDCGTAGSCFDGVGGNGTCVVRTDAERSCGLSELRLRTWRPDEVFWEGLHGAHGWAVGGAGGSIGAWGRSELLDAADGNVPLLHAVPNEKMWASLRAPGLPPNSSLSIDGGGPVISGGGARGGTSVHADAWSAAVELPVGETTLRLTARRDGANGDGDGDGAETCTLAIQLQLDRKPASDVALGSLEIFAGTRGRSVALTRAPPYKRPDGCALAMVGEGGSVLSCTEGATLASDERVVSLRAESNHSLECAVAAHACRAPSTLEYVQHFSHPDPFSPAPLANHQSLGAKGRLEIALGVPVGASAARLLVTAEDGTVGYHELRLWREPSSDATLAYLSVGGTVEPSPVRLPKRADGTQPLRIPLTMAHPDAVLRLGVAASHNVFCEGAPAGTCKPWPAARVWLDGEAIGGGGGPYALVRFIASEAVEISVRVLAEDGITDANYTIAISCPHCGAGGVGDVTRPEVGGDSIPRPNGALGHEDGKGAGGEWVYVFLFIAAALLLWCGALLWLCLRLARVRRANRRNALAAAAAARGPPRMSGTEVLEALTPFVVELKCDGAVRSQFGDDSCAVCLSELVEGEQIAVLPCSHVFHAACIRDWLSRSGIHASCPLCKRVVHGGVLAEEEEEGPPPPPPPPPPGRPGGGGGADEGLAALAGADGPAAAAVELAEMGIDAAEIEALREAIRTVDAIREATPLPAPADGAESSDADSIAATLGALGDGGPHVGDDGVIVSDVDA